MRQPDSAAIMRVRVCRTSAEMPINRSMKSTRPALGASRMGRIDPARSSRGRRVSDGSSSDLRGSGGMSGITLEVADFGRLELSLRGKLGEPLTSIRRSTLGPPTACASAEMVKTRGTQPIERALHPSTSLAASRSSAA